jgi:hypothetical protein
MKDFSLSDEELNNRLKNIKGFVGVFPRDNVPHISHSQALILNLMPGPPGSHWCAVLGKTYVDPFGLPPPIHVSHLVSRYSTGQYQQYKSSECGLYCYYFVKNFLEGRSVEEILFNGPLEPWPNPHNEQVVKHYYFNS